MMRMWGQLGSRHREDKKALGGRDGRYVLWQRPSLATPAMGALIKKRTLLSGA